MRYPLFALFLISSVWTACESSPKAGDKTANQADTTSSKTTDLAMPRVWEVKTATNKVVVIKETHPKGASLSDLTIHFQGDTANVMRFTEVDPISATITTDLDKDGFDEVYMASTSVGTGSYSNLLGVSSNKDKSLSVIFVPEMDPNELKPGNLFDGYEGHDEYAIENGILIRRYPVKGDKKKMKSVPYQVVMGEGGLILGPKRN
ncbi:MAG: hypothetical protein ACKO6Q_04445 [Bacteroidota bacterium]